MKEISTEFRACGV